VHASPPSLALHAEMHCASAVHSESEVHALTTSQQLTCTHRSHVALPNGTESATSHAGAASTPASLAALAPASPKPRDCDEHAIGNANAMTMAGRRASRNGEARRIAGMVALVLARSLASRATRIDNRSSEL
jgi:hypothetical protein